jgi:nucleoside-diphosphate-sugar epimerase
MEGVNRNRGKLLIIGGTGFIGRSLAQHALKQGYKTTILSLNPPLVEKIIENVEYLQANIIDIKDLQKKITNSFDYVVNLSGYIDHSRFLDGGNIVIDAHFGGVQNLLQVLDWDRLKRFVQIGSSDEYGGSTAPQHEDLRESPISSYALGKVASTQLLQMLAKTENFPVVIFRLFLVYGPGQNSERFLPQVIKGCLSGDKFATSLGGQLRDFCYIDDVVNGILMALDNDKVNGEVINLASGEMVSIRTMIENVRDSIGKGKPKFGMVPYRIGENMELYANISKAKKLLGWKPAITLENGLRKTIDYFRL